MTTVDSLYRQRSVQLKRQKASNIALRRTITIKSACIHDNFTNTISDMDNRIGAFMAIAKDTKRSLRSIDKEIKDQLKFEVYHDKIKIRVEEWKERISYIR